MGLKFEAFFIIKSKGGALVEADCRPCEDVGLYNPQGTEKWYYFMLSTSRNFSKKNAITHGKSPIAVYAVTAVDYGVMVLHQPFLMGSYARCCSSFIAVRIVVVWSGSDLKGTSKVFRLPLRRSDPASCAKPPQINGYPVLNALGSVTGSDICAKGSKFIWLTPGVKVSYLTDGMLGR